jgi:FG-GAP-like repeat
MDETRLREFGNKYTSASLLLGDGRGNFAEAAGSPFEIGAKAFYVALVDLNRDGHADMIAAADTSVRVLIGDGRGGYTPAPGSPFGTGKGTWKLAVADVNADGKSDVAASNLESDSVTVLLGR